MTSKTIETSTEDEKLTRDDEERLREYELEKSSGRLVTLSVEETRRRLSIDC